MSERRFGLRSTLRAEKGTDLLRVHYSHKGDTLSSACRIVNERLLECVQPAQKKQRRAHAFHATFSKSSLESHYAALECIKTYSPTFLSQLKLHK